MDGPSPSRTHLDSTAGVSHVATHLPARFFGEIGRKLNKGEQRRVPQWLEKWYFVVTLAVLLAMLVLRLVATNGDRIWLSGLLIGLALAAAITNAWFTGKTWCNFICPVGPVERIYTEPGSLLQPDANSQCTRCTACKKYCPDIDQENGYWRDLSSKGRRIAGSGSRAWFSRSMPTTG